MGLDVDACILVGLHVRPGASLFSQAKQKRGTHTRQACAMMRPFTTHAAAGLVEDEAACPVPTVRERLQSAKLDWHRPQRAHDHRAAHGFCLLPPSEADHLRALAATIFHYAHSASPTLVRPAGDAPLGGLEPGAGSKQQRLSELLKTPQVNCPFSFRQSLLRRLGMTQTIALLASCNVSPNPTRRAAA